MCFSLIISFLLIQANMQKKKYKSAKANKIQNSSYKCKEKTIGNVSETHIMEKIDVEMHKS